MQSTVPGISFKTDVLKQQLPKLDFATDHNLMAQPDAAEVGHYLAYYDIDIKRQFPQVIHDIGFVESNGYTLCCHKITQPDARGTFFLLHGYYDHVGLFGNILRFLVSKQYNVVAYDLPGHGLSSGAKATIPDFAIYTRILEEILIRAEGYLPKPWHGFGQSTGCAILTSCLINREAVGKASPFEQVVLSAPLIRPWLWRLGRIQLHTARFIVNKLPRRYTDNSRNREFLKLAHNDPLAPDVLPTEWVLAMDRWIRKIEASTVKSPVSPLILQGTYDRTVDAEHNIPVLQKLFTNPEVLYLPDARHHLPNELPETVSELLNWLSERLQ